MSKSQTHSVGQNFEENVEEELEKIDPTALRYLLDQLFSPEKVPAVRKIIENVLDEPIPLERESV